MDWVSALDRTARPLADREADVAEAAKAALAKLKPGDRISTRDLVERMFPEADARGDAGLDARGHLFATVCRLAKPGRLLHGWATQGPPRPHKTFRTPVRPWLWHPYEEPAPAPVANPSQEAALERPLAIVYQLIEERDRYRDALRTILNGSRHDDHQATAAAALDPVNDDLSDVLS